MIIKTKFLGEIEIKETEILTFEQGLLGLPEYKQFILLGLDSDLPIALLQSTEAEEIGFVVAYPYAFQKEYAFDIEEEDKEQLKIEQVEDVVAYVIMTLNENFADSTMNLLAPLVINTKTKLAKQIVLQDNEQYPLRYPIGAFEGSVK